MSKCFVILGMHRSATSLTAKAFANEIYMGSDLMGPGKGNPIGHFEERDFIKLNNKILKKAGGSWDKPPSEAAILAVDFDNEIKRVITKHKRELWGWKDPRTVLTIRKYLPFLENPHFICNFRSPKEVDQSLKRRGALGCRKSKNANGLVLAQEYNKRLMEFLTNFIA